MFCVIVCINLLAIVMLHDFQIKLIGFSICIELFMYVVYLMLTSDLSTVHYITELYESWSGRNETFFPVW